MITTIIFDMNGVITDDEDIHELATQQIFEGVGVEVTPEIYREFCLGRTDASAFKDLVAKFGVQNQSVSHLIAAKSAAYQALIKGNLKVYAGVIELIHQLHKKYTLALTTSSTFEEVQAVMDQLKIGTRFKTIVCANDVSYGKPDPEPYLLTAKKLQVDCANCLVIEDSENGVQSAKAAGMKCIAITTTEKANKLTLADHIITNYSELSEPFIQNTLTRIKGIG
ncbi:MAG: HAD family phosphatase [Flavobacteriaceae bacterium]